METDSLLDHSPYSLDLGRTPNRQIASDYWNEQRPRAEAPAVSVLRIFSLCWPVGSRLAYCRQAGD